MTDDDLIAALEAAAIEAIRNERPGIVYDRSRLRGIQVDLEIRNNGVIVERETYVNRAANVSRVLGLLPQAPGGGARAEISTRD